MFCATSSPFSTVQNVGGGNWLLYFTKFRSKSEALDGLFASSLYFYCSSMRVCVLCLLNTRDILHEPKRLWGQTKAFIPLFAGGKTFCTALKFLTEVFHHIKAAEIGENKQFPSILSRDSKPRSCLILALLY